MSEVTESGLPPEVEAKLKADGIDFVVVTTKAGPVAFRGLKRTEYQRWQQMIRDPKASPNASEQICSYTVVYPALHVFQTYIEKYPAILHKCGDVVLTFSGFDSEAEVKKFESGSIVT